MLRDTVSHTTLLSQQGKGQFIHWCCQLASQNSVVGSGKCVNFVPNNDWRVELKG